MSKPKVSVTQDDESFEWKSRLISTSTKKIIKINNFLQLIEDESMKMDEIMSPKFKLGGVDFSIDVYPDNGVHGCSGLIGVYLHNYGNEAQTTSVTVKEASGLEGSWEMDKVSPGKGWGFTKFLSHEKYRKWAKDHADVLKLEVTVTLHSKAEGEGDGWTRTKLMPEPSTQETFATFGKMILEDDATTDFTIRCPTKEFRVHRNVLCARSEALRASILSPMQEAAKGEIFIKDVGEKTLSTIINFIYTGELELGENPDIVDLAWTGTKYLLGGFMELLTLRLQMRKEEFPGEMIADLLIAAHRHGAEDLRKLAMAKIRTNKKIFDDPGFKKEMEVHPSILIDIFKDL